jgi:hypothetical protein
MAIQFPDSVVEAAWQQSKGQCQCTRSSHYHGHNRCKTRLYIGSRGKDSRMGWEAQPIDPEGDATLENCEIICHICYTRIHLYGG